MSCYARHGATCPVLRYRAMTLGVSVPGLSVRPPTSITREAARHSNRYARRGATKLIKSKKRVADHGEVFTPPWLVEAMLNLVKDETERIELPLFGAGMRER